MCFINWPPFTDCHLHVYFSSLPVCLVGLSFCLRQLVRLCGHPSVYLPVYRHACVSACILSARLSVTAKCCMFIPLPLCGAHPVETLRRLIRGWAHVKLIAFQRRSFWQWYWWMSSGKMWHGIASCRNLMPALWSPNEFHLSKQADRLHQADQCKNVKSCVCVYLFMETCIYTV